TVAIGKYARTASSKRSASPEIEIPEVPETIELQDEIFDISSSASQHSVTSSVFSSSLQHKK
ncbi:hypothetical protein HK096_003748, partial [Nowakowskiella sp. JEL0078]